MDLVIRELTGPDLSKDFLDTLAGLAEVNLSIEEAMKVFQRRLRTGVRTFVALNHERVVGTLSLFIEQKFIHQAGKVAHIEDVAVHRDFQQHGIGSKLLRHAIAEAGEAGCYKALLQCFEERAPFYERLGFRRHDRGMRLEL
jgi:glucosamine-phosphate N-acetyltransferase